MDPTTRYMGLELKNPLVASASPLNAHLGNIRRLEDSGAAAIVLPSIFEEQIEAEMRQYATLTAAGLESSPEAQSYFPESKSLGRNNISTLSGAPLRPSTSPSLVA